RIQGQIVLWNLKMVLIYRFLIHCKSSLLPSGQLVAGTCEIVTLDRDSSQPRRTIARQTARCACRKGQIAGTTRARPACVDVRIVRTRQWCEMSPCLDDEGCNLLVNQSGWTCTQPGGRVKTTTVRTQPPLTHTHIVCRNLTAG
uniref:TAFA chemokine like family member 5 n=1 Tax=Stegastes partitus TaxID=144197 RepID=A0A3B5B984_9TELE